MRIVNGKISTFFCLPVFAPADNAGGQGDQSGQAPNQGNQNNGQQNNAGELDPDSDSILEDLMGGDDGDDDEDSLGLDFEEQEQEDPDEAARVTESTKNLGQMIQTKLDGLGIKPEDIPEDFDASDRSQVANLLSKVNQNAARQVISVIPEVLKHALGIIVPKLEKKIQTASVSTSKKSEATKAFNGLGLKGADRTLGAQIYKNGIARGMSPEKAARATNKALSSLRGGSDRPFNDSRGNNRTPANNGMREGGDALDNMFGRK